MNPLTRTIAVYAVVLVIGLAVGWLVNGWRLGTKVESMKAKYSEAELAVQKQAIETMVSDARNMNLAAQGARVKTTDIEKRLTAIHKELTNARPLPLDCRMDDFRMRKLSEAVSALQSTLSGGKPESAVPDTRRPN